MLIAGLNKTTLLDYPGRVAATIFTGGCNFRCPFCHNAGLVLTPSSTEIFSEEDVFSFLQKRKNVLGGVCVTGGEPTLQEDLAEFISKIKSLGYAVKLDTNGYRPEVLRSLLEEGLLDYVAMDIKNCVEKYELTAGVGIKPERIRESVDILKKSGIDYEFRTTVVKEFHDREDIRRIGNWIKGCRRYYLQQFVESENIIGMQDAADMLNKQVFHGYEKEDMQMLAADVQEILGSNCLVQLRGID